MRLVFCCCLLSIGYMVIGQRVRVESPNHRVVVGLNSAEGGEWWLSVGGMIPKITLGLVRSDQDFFHNLRFIKAGKPSAIVEEGLMMTGWHSGTGGPKAAIRWSSKMK
jgi:alpha-glucosidase